MGKKVGKLCFYLLTILAIVFSSPISTFAKLPESKLRMFGQNDILFYDPSEGNCDYSSHTGASDGSDVYMIGDSITVLSQTAIKEVLPQITINAQSGIYFSKTESGLSSGVSRIPEMGDQSILVFALGTNGGIYQDDINNLFEALNGKDVKVILMTIYYRDKAESQMEDSNALVKSVAEQYDNVTYLDWYAAASANPDGLLAGDGFHPNAEAGTKKFAKVVKAAVNAVSTVGVEANTGNGNFEAIMNAKNAAQNVPHVNYNSPPRADGWSANWSDDDENSMANLLEKFGDLAYQLGKVVGAPYVAILVQMRYEDSNSVCGDNNYWGNGCDPKHAYPGGATVKASNLGEGFSKYGKTLTNGMHNQALGTADPKEYLEKIGPTWVQGDANGAGYASIEAMKRSVDALQAFIESSRGQEIVNAFGSYTGTYSGGVMCENEQYASNGVTTLDINGVTYAFPIAYATKANYLNGPSGGNNLRSELSTKACGWCHHDYAAVDLGIAYNKMVLGKDFALSDYPQWSSTKRELGTCGLNLQECEASTGAPVVALTDGTITNYKTYSRAEPSADTAICASVYLKSTVGDKDLYYNIHLGYEPEFAKKVGDQVQAGDVIGHIGLESCAQGTQAHVHLQTSDASTKIKTIIDKLYDALPADAAELAARETNGQVGEGGLTYDQAKQLAKNYGANRGNSTSSAIGQLWYMCGGAGGSNCVSFSAFFMNKFTRTNVGQTPGNGYQVVGNLARRGVRTGSQPKVWSVFSWSNGGDGHTGVILGYQNGEWIVGHASCSRGHSGLRGEGDGTNAGGGSAFIIKSASIDEAIWGHSQSAEYAYFDDQVNMSAISKYLSTGE